MSAQPAQHPTDQTLQAYGLGQIDDVSAQAVHAHLEGCPACRRRVAEITSDSFLGRLRDAQAGPSSLRPAVSSTEGLSMIDGGAPVAAPPPAGTLPPGLADHADYEILRELGRGGMGVVYLARNTLMGRMEVLKVVGGHLISRPAVLERFLREIRSAARLHHPNIVTAYAALRLGESLVLAMEYVEGLDLSRMVKARGALPVANACHYVHQAALGLQHAHEHGMVHRDIKPANLILAREGKKAVVKVLDFGLAKVTSEGQADSGLTREGQMLGTPDYIAPEQIRDAQSADIRADIYSLGCTLYYLLSGRAPFTGDNLWDLYQAHFSMDAHPLNLVRPEVPVELAALAAKMLAKEPGRRFQEPKDVARALEPFFKKGSVESSGSRPEFSRATSTSRPGGTAGAVVDPQRPAEKRPPAPAATDQRPATTEPGTIPAGLVDLRRTDSRHDTILDPPGPAATPAPDRRSSPERPRVVDRLKGASLPVWWTAAAAGVLLLGLVIVWAAGVLRVKPRGGVIVLENLPEQAEVYVDGDKVTVLWPGGGVPAEITIPPGKHGVQVKMPGFTTFGEEVTIVEGGRRGIRVHQEPVSVEPPASRVDRNDEEARKPWPQERVSTEQPASREQHVANQPTDPPPPVTIDRARFTEFAGKWTVDGNELIQSDLTKWNCALMFGDDRWTDYDISVDAMRTGGKNSFSVYFRSAGRGNEFEFQVSGEGNGTCMARVYEQGRSNIFDRFHFALQDRSWYTARIHVRGNHFACSLFDCGAGKEVGRMGVSDDRFPRGRVGLGSFLSSYRFKNIRVTSPDGAVLWEGPPRISSPNDAVAPSPSVAERGASVPGSGKNAGAVAPRRQVPPAADRLEPGSVWVAEANGFTFTVLEREGERFKALFLVAKQVREVRGTIRNGRLRWLARDVKAIAGKPGHDNEGQIKGT